MTNTWQLLNILEQPSSWSTSRIHPSWPCSRLKLSPTLASPYDHASCCHDQPSILLFIAKGQVSHLVPSAIWVASHQCTSKHHNNATRHMCTHAYTSHQHYYSSFLSTHLPYFLAGWMTPTRHVGYTRSIKTTLRRLKYCVPIPLTLNGSDFSSCRGSNGGKWIHKI